MISHPDALTAWGPGRFSWLTDEHRPGAAERDAELVRQARLALHAARRWERETAYSLGQLTPPASRRRPLVNARDAQSAFRKANERYLRAARMIAAHREPAQDLDPTAESVDDALPAMAAALLAASPHSRKMLVWLHPRTHRAYTAQRPDQPEVGRLRPRIRSWEGTVIDEAIVSNGDRTPKARVRLLPPPLLEQGERVRSIYEALRADGMDLPTATVATLDLAADPTHCQ